MAIERHSHVPWVHSQLGWCSFRLVYHPEKGLCRSFISHYFNGTLFGFAHGLVMASLATLLADSFSSGASLLPREVSFPSTLYMYKLRVGFSSCLEIGSTRVVSWLP